MTTPTRETIEQDTGVRQDALTPLRIYARGFVNGVLRASTTLERVLHLEARVLVAFDILGIGPEYRIAILETARDDARRELGPDADTFDVRVFGCELVLAYLRILTRRGRK